MLNINKTLILSSIIALVFTISAFTQPERQNEAPKPTNLKVLPKNISNEELSTVMKGFNAALGVKCGHCHSPKANGEKGLDFISDTNPNKNIARSMMKMTKNINKKYFKGEHQGLVHNITCETCHNKQATPQTVTLK